MLQQTRAEVVAPYYERFLEAFPDLRSLARARADEVLALWSGLGYYRRAVSLHRAARLVLDRHRGALPRDVRALRELPGIGPYTAAAIGSIAFGIREPALDGNVRRVLCRLLARRRAEGPEARRLLGFARALVEAGPPGRINEALMELGAVVCTPRAPRCGVCPLAGTCLARRSGRPQAYPSPTSRPRPKACRVAVALVRHRGRLLLERPADGSPLRGSWDLPAVELRGCASARRALESALRLRHGVLVRAEAGPAARATHSILDRRLRLELLDCRLVAPYAGRSTDTRWTRPNDLGFLHVSGATRKLVAAAGLIASG